MNANNTLSFARTSAKKLNERAMLVNLSISKWTGRKQDKKVTSEVLVEKQAAQDAGNWLTRIVPAESLKAIQAIESAARNYHYSVTLPWSNDGPRILPSALFLDYTAKIRGFEHDFRKVTEEFVAKYPQLAQDAAHRLGDLFVAKHFPGVDKLRNSFSFGVTILPLPEATDFRVELGEDLTAEIQAQIQQQAGESVKLAMADVWQRLYDVVEHIADKLSDAKGKFKDTLIGNLVELVDLLPALNITNDPDLDRLRRQAAAKLANQDPDALRENPAVRAEAAGAAADILKQMSQLLGK